MTITEPSTMITDYVLAAVTLLAASKLLTNDGTSRSVRFWAGALAFTGLAALAGGTYHGLQLSADTAVLSAMWKTTMVAIGLASFCFACGAILAAFAGAVRNALLIVVGVQLTAYLLWMIGHDDFRYAVYDYAPTMVGVLIIQVYVWATRRDPTAKWIAGGILISFAGAFIQMQGTAIHRHFNHNDLYHVIQMVGIYFFYRGGSWTH